MNFQRLLRSRTTFGRAFPVNDERRPEQRVGIAGRHSAGSGVDQARTVDQRHNGALQGLRAAQLGVMLLPGEDPGGQKPGRRGFHGPQADQ